MLGRLAARILNTLSGRFLLLTVAFVMLAEVLIFVPSIARFRVDYLQLRLEKAQIASLALLASDDEITADLEAELLANAGVFNVVLRRDEVRQLVLSSPIPLPVEQTYDLRFSGPLGSVHDAMMDLLQPQSRVIRRRLRPRSCSRSRMPAAISPPTGSTARAPSRPCSTPIPATGRKCCRSAPRCPTIPRWSMPACRPKIPFTPCRRTSARRCC